MINEENLYQAPVAEVRDIPETGIQYQKATRGSRLAANFIDGIVFSLLYLPIVLIARNSRFEKSNIVVGLLAMGMLALMILNVIFIIRSQQSIGKKLAGIKIVRKDFSPCSGGRIIFLRVIVIWGLSVIPYVGAIFSLLNILMIFRESLYCWHDDIADTCVVQL